MASATACRDAALNVDSDDGVVTLMAVSVITVPAIEARLLGLSERSVDVLDVASAFVAYSPRPALPLLWPGAELFQRVENLPDVRESYSQLSVCLVV